jgi:hypothetical protein
MGIEALFPELVEATAGVDAAQGQDVFRPRLSPEHARLFAAGADNRLASGFDDLRTMKGSITSVSSHY